jgi:hypothetical protein
VVVVAAVVLIVAVTLPVVVVELSATEELESAHVGTSTAVEGLEVVSVQVSVAVPA